MIVLIMQNINIMRRIIFICHTIISIYFHVLCLMCQLAADFFITAISHMEILHWKCTVASKQKLIVIFDHPKWLNNFNIRDHCNYRTQINVLPSDFILVNNQKFWWWEPCCLSSDPVKYSRNANEWVKCFSVRELTRPLNGFSRDIITS